MDHLHAIQEGCSERYLLGEMEDQERHDFEDHFFDCMECADDIKITVAFVDNAREVLAEEDVPAVVETQATPIALAWLKRSRLQEFDLRPVLAVAAMLLLAVFSSWQSFVLIPQLRHELTEARSPQAVSWEFLSVSRSTAPTLELSPKLRLMGFRLSRSSQRSFPEYRCELQDAQGNLVQSAVIPAAAPGDELGLVLPVSGLAAGSYVIVLSGLETPDDPIVAPELARYRFDLKFVEEEPPQ